MVDLITVGLYLIACFIAWGLHELAHYWVHRIHAESVTIGINRWGPYTDAIYSRDAPNYAIRLGSIAPTLIYGPLAIGGIGWYVVSFPMPQFDLVEWMYVLIPIAILVVPTAADLRGCLYAHHL